MSDTYISVFGDNVIPPSGSSYAAVSLTADTQFQWPELAVGEFLLYDMLDVSADGAWSILLPSAATVSEGRTVTFKNLSLSTITLKDYALGTVGTLATGEVKTLYLTDNATDAGTWGLIALGAGTTLADASALAGDGLTVNVGKLAVAAECVISTTGVTLNLGHWARVLLSTNTGFVLYTLPNGTATYNDYFFHVANQGTGTLLLLAQVGQTIDGASDKSLQPGESATVIYAGGSSNKWITVGYGRSTQFQFTKLVLDISSGTPFTLTSTQAQNKLMQFIGTATEAITVNVPQIVAVYYLECSYAGAFPLTIQASGGAGITLGQNDRAIVYCDGIDIVVAQTTIGATNISGGSAGAVLYQAGVSSTAFTAAGSVGSPLVSGGTAAPTFVPGIAISRDGSNSSRISMATPSSIWMPDLYFQNSAASGASYVGILPGAGGSVSALTLYKGTSLYDDPGSVTLNIWGQAARLSTGAGSATTPALYLSSGNTYLALSDDPANGYAVGYHFYGTAPRIIGDFSNATESSRLMFKSGTVDGLTCVGATPNGTGTQSCFTAYGAADPSNAAYSQITATATQSKIIAGKTGTGSYKPLALNVGGADVATYSEAAATLGNMTASVSRNSTLEYLIFNGDAGSSAVAQQTVQTNAGYLAFKKFSTAGGAGSSITSTGGIISIGTTDAQQLRLKTNNTDRVWIGSTGIVGIGAENAGAYGKFTLAGTGYQAITVVDSEASGAVGGIAANGTFNVNVGAVSNHDLALIVNGAPRLRMDTAGNSLHVSPTGGLGYGAGAGGTVTQTTSRTTTTPAINFPNGDITLFTAAGSATPASFSVANTLVAAKDVPTIAVRGATNKYITQVTNVVAGTSFEVTFWTTGGTAVDTPIFHFNLGKGS